MCGDERNPNEENEMIIDYAINSIYKLTNQTMGARYGFPVVHNLQTGREYGPSDTLDSTSRVNPTLAKLLANIPPLTAWGASLDPLPAPLTRGFFIGSHPSAAAR